jgi:hypothetical protein
MSRRQRKTEAKDPTHPAGPTVTVCRGCCCGTIRKHPGINHARQLDQLRQGVAGMGQIRISDCLDACERSNVAVIAPSAAGRAAGARPVWLEYVLDDDIISDIAAWVRDGGPGIAEAPLPADLHIFEPSRRVRVGAEQQ